MFKDSLSLSYDMSWMSWVMSVLQEISHVRPLYSCYLLLSKEGIWTVIPAGCHASPSFSRTPCPALASHVSNLHDELGTPDCFWMSISICIQCYQCSFKIQLNLIWSLATNNQDVNLFHLLACYSDFIVRSLHTLHNTCYSFWLFRGIPLTTRKWWTQLTSYSLNHCTPSNKPGRLDTNY